MKTMPIRMNFTKAVKLWQNVKENSSSEAGWLLHHYTDVIMNPITSQITSLTVVCSTVYSDADQRKHQSSASLAFVWGVHRGPVNSPHKWPVTRKMFSFDDVIMIVSYNDTWLYGLMPVKHQPASKSIVTSYQSHPKEQTSLKLKTAKQLSLTKSKSIMLPARLPPSCLGVLVVTHRCHHKCFIWTLFMYPIS